MADSLGFIVQPQESLCLSDNLMMGTVFGLQVIGNSTQFEFSIQQGQKPTVVLQSYRNEILVRYTKTMDRNEQIALCFSVYGTMSVKFDLNYKKGAEVNDQQLVANRQNLNEMEIELQDIDLLLRQIGTEAKQTQLLEVANGERKDRLATQINGFALLTLAMLCITTYVIVRLIKRILIIKKAL